MPQPKKNGFTLVELLVVISIIGLLIAILLPALSQARTTASGTQSIANLRGLQICFSNYSSDNRSASPFITFPTLAQGNTGKYPGYYWQMVLFDASYVEDIRVFWSPARDLNAQYSAGTGSLRSKFPAMTTRTSNAYTNFNNAVNWSFVGYGLTGGSSASNGVPNIRNVDTASRIKLDRTISLVETWNKTVCAPTLPCAGYYFNLPSFNNTSGSYLFNFNGSVARSYWDGHAVISESASIGWDTTAQDNFYAGNPYGGKWTYTSNGQYRTRAPWYTTWEIDGVTD